MGLLETREMFWTDFFDECRSHARIALTTHGIGFNLEENSAINDLGPGLFPGLSLLRVVKEAMANAVKHAACRQVLIRADFSPGQMRLTVCDNGCGFAEERREGRGLRNMAARVKELGGTMSCRSKEGVELEFRLPLPLKLLDTIPGNEC
jgi:signal transduction histidine kinase